MPMVPGRKFSKNCYYQGERTWECSEEGLRHKISRLDENFGSYSAMWAVWGSFYDGWKLSSPEGRTSAEGTDLVSGAEPEIAVLPRKGSSSSRRGFCG